MGEISTMNRVYFLAFVRLIVLILMLCVTPSSSASADTATGVIGCKVSLVTDSKMVQGQPILLHYTLTNFSNNESLGIHMGINKTEWYTLSLMDGAGRSAMLIPDNRPQKSAGAHRGTFERLPPLASSSGYIVVSRFFAVQHPGNFLVKVHISAPYATGDAGIESTAQMESDIKNGDMIFTKDFALPLTVAPTNVLALQETASSLKQDFLRNRNSDLHDADLDALFSMPEAVAAPVWEALAGEASAWDTKAVARKLAERRSIRATDALVGMLDNPALRQYDRTYIKRCIDEIYNDANTSLHNHIKALATSRGTTMSEKTEIPTTID
jgi:flagellar hook-basal body complex protein FliE